MKIPRTERQAAFTMVEIAISLAVIGFALVAIIGVLPRGLGVQRENREETIINQDAAVFFSAIRNGARGMDDLTNYVLAIMINKMNNSGGNVTNTYLNPGHPLPPSFSLPNPVVYLTNGSSIVGLLSTPKHENTGGVTWTNQIIAFVRALSGPASEKPPQSDAEVQADAFSYQMICETLPIASYDGDTAYGKPLTNNLHELRLTFRWPLLPSGKPGNGRQTFRTQVGGQLLITDNLGHSQFFFEPQIFAQPPS